MQIKLFNKLSYSGNYAIISDKDEYIKYSDLDNISTYLQRKIPSRSLVFSLNKNTPGALSGYYSFLKNKITPLMLDASIDFDLLETLMSTYSPEYLWLPEQNVSKFPNGQEICSVFDYTLIKFQNKKKFQLHKDLALLLGTSGSTGSPKFVKLTYENLKSNALSIIEYLSIDQTERPITTLPMSYSFGLSIINSHIFSGATILLTNKSIFDKEFWSFLNKKKATSMSGVPYTFEMLKKLRFFNMDLPQMKTITQAGGKLNDGLNLEYAEYCKNSGKRFLVMYGQTEATARMSYLPDEYSIKKLGSMGIAIPGGEFSLIDEVGNIIDEHEKEGELVYKGNNVSMGYAMNGYDLSKNDENSGTLVTGDMAKMDSDGFYYIVGRKKRFIKLFGNRVNLDETERLLKNVISDCACTGKDDEMIIYITDETKIKDVRSFISQKTGINHQAFNVKYISEIPKNSSGKIIYSKLPF